MVATFGAPGGMLKIRNPLHGLVLTILVSLGITFLGGLGVLLLPFFELRVIVLGFIALGAGAMGGRTSLLGFIGLSGSFLGGFIGVLFLQFLLWSTGWEYVLALGLGAIAGLGGLITGKLGPRRARQDLETMLRTVRCPRCGARVGLSAVRCWSCRAYLPPS
jgi:hypothetical protein